MQHWPIALQSPWQQLYRTVMCMPARLRPGERMCPARQPQQIARGSSLDKVPWLVPIPVYRPVSTCCADMLYCFADM